MTRVCFHIIIIIIIHSLYLRMGLGAILDNKVVWINAPMSKHHCILLDNKLSRSAILDEMCH